jgi:hypothetical protein
MRTIVIICFLISVRSFGQIPSSGRQELLQVFKHHFDTVIAYTRHCTWEGPHYNILGLKGDDLRIMSASIDSLYSKIIKRSDFDIVQTKWNIDGFWLLSNDSLNKRSYSSKTGEIVYFGVSDGCHEIFEMIDDTHLTAVATYEVEWFQNKLHVRQRDVFISGRNHFLSLFD